MARHLVLDTNVFLLLIVGLADTRYIASHDNTRAFDLEDFRILQRPIKLFDGFIMNQAVLAQTSNLMMQYREPGRSRISNVFRQLVRNSHEVQIKSAAAVDRAEFLWLGFTDSVLLEIQKDYLVFLTADANLYRAAYVGGGFAETWNFNHIREAERQL